MTDERVVQLRITADDAGQSRSIDAAIELLLRMRVITSVAAFANFSGGLERIATLVSLPEIEVGIHYCLSSGRPVLEPSLVPSLVRADGFFKSPTQDACVMPVSDAIERYMAAAVPMMALSEIEQELRAQLRCFQCIIGSAPKFVTVHHDLDKSPKVAQVVDSLMPGMCCRQSLLARGFLSGYCFEFLPENATWHDGIRSVLRLLYRAMTASSESGGVVEIACHPGFPSEQMDSFTVYRQGRFIELQSWQDPQVREFLANGQIRAGMWNGYRWVSE